MSDKLKLVRNYAKEYWALLLCGFYILMTWLYNLPKLYELSSFLEFQILLNYEIGFIQRGFIGTLLLPIRYFTAKDFAIIFAVIALIFIAMYMAFCVWILRGSLEKKLQNIGFY